MSFLTPKGRLVGRAAALLFPIVREGKWGYINQQGEIALAPQFDKADTFSEGLAAIRLGKQVGYIDTTGKIVINPRFDDGWAFQGGVAPVKMGNKLGYINMQGQFVWEPES